MSRLGSLAAVLSGLGLMLTLACAALAAPFAAAPPFDRTKFTQTVADALAFIGPRGLEAVPPARLTLWGLGGLTTLDPGFAVELRDGRLRLMQAGRPALTLAAPRPDDDPAWAQVAGEIAQAGWNGSDAVRDAGAPRITAAFFAEMFSHLDPYSRYIPSEEALAERTARQGHVGIGLRLTVRAGALVVASVQPGGPAAQAGLRPGDRVLQIDGEAVDGTDPETAATLLDGVAGSEAMLELRAPDGRVRQVTAIRATTVETSVSARLAGDALVLRIELFNAETGERLAEALTRAMAAPHPPRGVVLDLRGNRGGLLREAVAAARTLLDGVPSPRVVARTVGRAPDAGHDYTADGRDLAAGRPAVVLVDGRTASAAEILAAALSDQGRAVVVGSATFGKGLVQTVATLPDGGDLFLSWSRVLAPLGWPIQGPGVMPQLCTSLGDTALRAQLAELARGRLAQAPALARSRAARAPLSPAEVLSIRNACPPAAGREMDMTTARFLLEHPKAYAVAVSSQ